MSAIPEFSANELWIIQDTLKQRYRRDIEVELVEIEMRLNPHSTVLTPCPAAYWQEDGANFVIVKISEGHYRCQFFYRVHQQYGTGREEYTDLTECVVNLLQVQTDHQLNNPAE
ncbi:MAG: hypothetical protein OQL08_12175 [Gammaproteobacteria bacterium]|nr:hypothetical protein [Gammaproteobacteria bacterium]